MRDLGVSIGFGISLGGCAGSGAVKLEVRGRFIEKGLPEEKEGDRLV